MKIQTVSDYKHNMVSIKIVAQHISLTIYRIKTRETGYFCIPRSFSTSSSEPVPAMTQTLTFTCLLSVNQLRLEKFPPRCKNVQKETID